SRTGEGGSRTSYFLLPRDEHHLQPCFLRRFTGTACRSGKPAFHLLQADRVFRDRLAHFDIEDPGWSDALPPLGFAENPDCHARRLVEALRLHYGGVPDPAMVLVGDFARSRRHRPESNIFVFCSPCWPKKMSLAAQSW